MKILVFDNYDSFTYNLVQMVERIVGKEFVYVFKNDEISLEEVEKYDKEIRSIVEKENHSFSRARCA